MIVFLKAQLVPVLSDSESERGEKQGGLLAAGTSNKWTEAHKDAVETEINKDRSYPLPTIPGVLYWLLLWLLHYWIKSHLRARETEEGEVRGHDLY